MTGEKIAVSMESACFSGEVGVIASSRPFPQEKK
jgi:hypothetical protein